MKVALALLGRHEKWERRKSVEWEAYRTNGRSTMSVCFRVRGVPGPHFLGWRLKIKIHSYDFSIDFVWNPIATQSELVHRCTAGNSIKRPVPYIHAYIERVGVECYCFP